MYDSDEVRDEARREMLTAYFTPGRLERWALSPDKESVTVHFRAGRLEGTLSTFEQAAIGEALEWNGENLRRAMREYLVDLDARPPKTPLERLVDEIVAWARVAMAKLGGVRLATPWARRSLSLRNHIRVGRR